MKLIAKSIGYAALAVLALLCLLLLTLRFAPATVVSVVNAVQDAAVIEANDIEVRFFSPSVGFEQLNVTMPAQDIVLNKGSARLDFSAWWSDAPFWGVDVERVQIEPKATSTQPVSDAQAGPIGPVEVLPYLTFRQIRIGELVMGGDSDLAAQLLATQEGRDIVLQASGTVAGDQLEVQGTLRRAAAALAFDLALTARNDDPAKPQGSANIEGTFASSIRMQLDIAAGTAELAIGEATHQFSDLQGQVTIVPEDGGDLVTLAQLGGSYLGPDWSEPLAVTVNGDVLLHPERITIDTRTQAGASNIALVLAGDSALENWQGNVRVTSGGLHPSIAIAPYQSEDLFPLTLNTELYIQSNAIGLSELELETPTNALAGDLSLRTGQPFKVVADINADRLYIPLVGSADAEPDAASDANDETVPPAEAIAETAADSPDDTDSSEDKLFSTAPIDWSWIETAAIDVTLNAKTLRLQQASFEKLQLALKNADGTLRLSPLSAQLGDGGFTGAAELTLNSTAEDGAQAVALETTVGVSGIALESFGFVPQEELRGGALEVALDLTANGASAHALASSLSGDILLMVEDATLMNDFIELAGSDLLMETLNKLNPFAKEDPTTELNCALVHFDAQDGELTTDNQLVMETSKMEIVGNGSIDLDSEKIDITFTPNAKSGVGINVGSLVKFLKLGGTLASPRPAADAGGLLKSGIAIGAAISTGGASVVAEGLAKRALGAGSACDAFKDDDAPEVDSAETAATAD